MKDKKRGKQRRCGKFPTHLTVLRISYSTSCYKWISIVPLRVRCHQVYKIKLEGGHRWPHSLSLTKWAKLESGRTAWRFRGLVTDYSIHTPFGWSQTFWVSSTPFCYTCWWAENCTLCSSPVVGLEAKLTTKNQSTHRTIPGARLRLCTLVKTATGLLLGKFFPKATPFRRIFADVEHQ